MEQGTRAGTRDKGREQKMNVSLKSLSGQFGNPLNKYIHHYEGLSYDTEALHESHQRAKRALSPQEKTVHLDFHAHGRSVEYKYTHTHTHLHLFSLSFCHPTNPPNLLLEFMYNCKHTKLPFLGEKVIYKSKFV